jgi:hypothetical protein
MIERNGGRESRRPRPALGCNATEDDEGIANMRDSTQF